ncbi:MAG: glycoside hydrolase family 27 protein [Clostridia bacterium]|nr:glycoside hydrolase family 27 protein [Clostridia bacterium]
MLAMTPPMGYNTWNTFGTNISADLIKETADAMVDEGLLDAGYKYLVIDDCWSERQRDPVTDKIVPDKNKFPLGMNDVSDYVHSKGLKFGMYSCAGVRTCADYPGSFDHEFLDAETFAEYGCDFLKYDFCYKPELIDGPLLYKRMGMALKSCGREILFSACNWGSDNVGTWIRSTGAHMYRSTGDIFDNFNSAKDIAMSQVQNYCYSAPGCFNDMDMLTVGMYGKGNVGNNNAQSDVEYRTQFALWCLFGSPLMIGCDVRNMTAGTKAILTNKELIALDQDPECRGVINVTTHPWSQDLKVFFRHLSDGEYAIGFFNFSDHEAVVPFYTFNAGLVAGSGRAFVMRDLFSGEEVGPVKDYYNPTLASHDCKIYRAKVVKV